MKATEAEIAWAAGLFEGEGCSIVVTSKRWGTKHPHVRLAMTDEEPVRRFAAIVGFGNLRLERHTDRKDMWCWYSNNKREVPALAALLPWLAPRRRENMEKTLAACELADMAEARRKASVTRMANGRCRRCDCPSDEKTVGCSACRNRHSYRRRVVVEGKLYGQGAK